ncbi:MAG TPA: hypothetical protein VE913_10605 [Longimicrobium sp.]|nr:hypothetical protein [Longimicrobium sp.]
MSLRLLRPVLAVVLLVLAIMQLRAGNPLAAAVDLLFAMVAGLLTLEMRPGARRTPRGFIVGLVAVGIVLWIATLVTRLR